MDPILSRTVSVLSLGHEAEAEETLDYPAQPVYILHQMKLTIGLLYAKQHDP